jgi:hypothetical protein
MVKKQNHPVSFPIHVSREVERLFEHTSGTSSFCARSYGSQIP